jgi:hypothetical protein
MLYRVLMGDFRRQCRDTTLRPVLRHVPQATDQLEAPYRQEERLTPPG